MYSAIFKRFLDLILATIGLLLLSPLFIIITLCLYYTNKGKPFFYQERPGKNEKIFRVVKFKTMNDKTDDAGNLLSDERRITPIGRFIRSTSLDELPQLFNILKGDMSLVGPRPLLKEYLPYYNTHEKIRHTVKPGITGLAQVNGRNNLNWDKRLSMDVYYVENQSFLLDIKILLKTIKSVLKKEGVNVVPGEQLKPLNIVREKWSMS